MKYIKLSESDTELTITHAFLGASRNLIIIEKYFTIEKFISIGQYYNYLSSLALTIELGLKNIIKNTSKLRMEHDLEILFNHADSETNKCLSKKIIESYSEEWYYNFIAILKRVSNIYIEARYCYGASLEYFINDKYITNNLVNIDEIINKNEPYIMLRLFLEELGEYHNFIHKSCLPDKVSENELNSKLKKVIKNKFEIQETINVTKKENN
jgi:hypothetical protein